jgi:hypothetical protein
VIGTDIPSLGFVPFSLDNLMDLTPVLKRVAYRRDYAK